MNGKLQLLCIFVFHLPLIIVVILINEGYYLCRKDCGESVSLCISYLRVTNSRVELYHIIIHWNLPKLITHQHSLAIGCSKRKKNESRKGYNLTNTFSVLVITLRRVFALTVVVLTMHFAAGFRFAHQQNFGWNKFSSVDFSGAGEWHILGMCFPDSEQEVKNSQSIVLCEKAR